MADRGRKTDQADEHEHTYGSRRCPGRYCIEALEAFARDDRARLFKTLTPVSARLTGTVRRSGVPTREHGGDHDEKKRFSSVP